MSRAPVSGTVTIGTDVIKKVRVVLLHDCARRDCPTESDIPGSRRAQLQNDPAIGPFRLLGYLHLASNGAGRRDQKTQDDQEARYDRSHCLSPCVASVDYLYGNHVVG